MDGMTDYKIIRRKIVTDVLDKYPDASSHTLARILFRDNPLFFKSHEQARGIVRIYRGVHGNHGRQAMKFTKYYKDESMA